MKLPRITHLGFLVLKQLSKNQWAKGSDIRNVLSEQGITHTLSAFYQLMKLLTDAKLINKKLASGEERKSGMLYHITADGHLALEESFKFYSINQS